MILKRRKKQPLWNKLRNLLWPRMGWGRTLRYYKHRTIRISDSTHSIAAGLAIGCAVSWTPAFGTHLIQAAFFCWIFRGNYIAAIIGTAFGNPWTFPFLFWIGYHVGKVVFWLFGFGDYFQDLPAPLGMEELMDHPMKVLFPMIVGGYICAAVTSPALYYLFYSMIKGARLARKLRIQRKAHKVAKEVTGQRR